MRPYFAVIADSFAEAARSRVLWGLLAVWTLILAAVSPFGLIEDIDYRFTPNGLINRQRLLAGLQTASVGSGGLAQQRVWEHLSVDTKHELQSAWEEGRVDDVRSGELCEGLNDCLKSPGLYDETAWPTAVNRSELAELIKAGDPAELEAVQLAKLNRRLIELAFPACFRTGAGRAIWIGYAGLKIADPLPVSREKVKDFIEAGILPGVLQLALGIIGLFVAVIVTSHLVPDMFAAGSLPLLLSKPINRSGLLIAKFVGGVAFIFLNIAFLLTGLYFVLGWRMGIWNAGLFACIPIFVFVFMIYYAVSTLAGLIWRNAIVSIIAVAVFWGLCFTLGVVHGITREIAVEDPQFNDLTVAGEHLVASSNRGEIQIFDPIDEKWQSVGGSDDRQRRVIGQCWIEEKQLLVFGIPEWSPFFGMDSRGFSLQTLDMRSSDEDPAPDGAEQADAAASGSESDRTPVWDASRIDTLPELPGRSERLACSGDEILIAGEVGVFRLNLDADREAASNGKLFGLVPLPYGQTQSEIYVQLTPPDQTFSSPMNVAACPGGDRFLLFSAGRLYLYERAGTEPDEEAYAATAEFDLGLDEGTLGFVGCNERYAVVFTSGESAFRVDLQSRELKAIDDPLLRALEPRRIVVEPDDGRFAVVSADGGLFVLAPDASDPHRIASDVAFAAAWKSPGQLLVVGERNRVSLIDIDRGTTTPVAGVTYSWVQRLYYSLIHPLYVINPKPAAAGQLIYEMLAPENPLALGERAAELESRQRISRDLWLPVWSNGLFIAVCLLLGCSYLHRQDI